MFEKLAVCRRDCTSGPLGTGGDGSTGLVRAKLGFETIRDNLADGAPRPTDMGIRFAGLVEDGGVGVGRIDRVGVMLLGPNAGVARPLRGILLGVTTTAGTLGGDFC